MIEEENKRQCNGDDVSEHHEEWETTRVKGKFIILSLKSWLQNNLRWILTWEMFTLFKIVAINSS